jgi:L-malate glycosyltransferase
LKILQLIQKPQLRGAEIFAGQLAAHLQEMGHEVLIISLQKGNQMPVTTARHIALNRATGQRLFDFSGWRHLAKIIRDFQPDVVQANAGDTLKYAVLSKWIFSWKAPIVFRNASMISSYMKSAAVKFWNKLLFRKVNHIVSVTEKSKEDILTLFPFMQDRIDVIPVGIETVPHTTGETTRRHLLHVGGFTFEKNHTGLLRIAKLLQATDLELLLAGDGPLRKAAERQASQLGLKKVRFLGNHAHVPELMKKARVLLLPSLIEGLPAVIIEAMYYRVPVVAYDVGGISEVITNGLTGWLVKAGDEEEFANAVMKVLQMDKENLHPVLAAAYHRVVSRFDNRVIAKRFEDVYGRVAFHA